MAPREIGLRFVSGAITSVLAGLVGLVDERAGGLFLAFPSILIASLTLVEQKEGATRRARMLEGRCAPRWA